MKTLIENNETSASYEFTSGTAVRQFTVTSGPQVTEETVVVDFEALADAEYQRWLEWLNITQE
jgi:hypothetical protein